MTQHSYDYDFFVIGAGSGGVRAARIAATHGAKVGIAEGRHYGGTCVNIGCVPKKLFAYASDYGPAFEDACGFGWNAEKPSFNWTTLLQNKNKEIERLNGIYASLLQNAGVEVMDGFASFVDEHTLEINGKHITADKILIATGGKPRRPTYPGAEHTIVSDDAFYLEKLPEHVVIEGGGYIAVEFAHIFHGLGAKVTLIYRGKQILREFDSDIGAFLTSEMQKQGINLNLEANITEISIKNDKYQVKTDKNEDIKCDLTLSAIGRVPLTENLNLDKIGIKTLKSGHIETNKENQTSIPHIYAVGDVTDTWQLTPVALNEGHCLVDRLFGNKPERYVSYENIPTAVFSNPPIGTVGLTEQQAKDQGFDVAIFKSTFKPMRHTLSGRDEKTLMKLIVDKKTDKVLGAHMCGTDAPEILQGIGIALKSGATKADFDATIGIHPTAAEEFVTMRSAVSE
ncbi:MAG: glutathione-disulfide reductase [Alphaproteobacteria bacterium]|nr:glutathione-disulfide reductase [Alphaproteobacteria bacterium]